MPALRSGRRSVTISALVLAAGFAMVIGCSPSRTEMGTSPVNGDPSAAATSPVQTTTDRTTPESSGSEPSRGPFNRVDADMALTEVTALPAFEGFGRFLFPTERGSLSGLSLRDAGRLLPYHSHIEASTSAEVINSLIAAVEDGEQVFYPIYDDDTIAADPGKQDTGLFFFRGRPGAPFAIISAGGGFSYVGSIHESLPHALELSRRGFNAFALQYRTGGAEVATEDLAAAISFVFANAEELSVATADYSLWGGSAGARMAAYLGSYGPAAYGGANLPRPGVVVMQYTGHTDHTAQDPPTFAVVGMDDGIANWRTMQNRIEELDRDGIDTEFHAYPDLGHGFGLGLGTSAEGWIDDAVAFWEQHLQQ